MRMEALAVALCKGIDKDIYSASIVPLKHREDPYQFKTEHLIG